MTRDEKIGAALGAVLAVIVGGLLAWGAWDLSGALIARLPK